MLEQFPSSFRSSLLYKSPKRFCIILVNLVMFCNHLQHCYALSGPDEILSLVWGVPILAALTKWCIRQTKINQVYTTLHAKQECSDLYFSRVHLNGTPARHDRIIKMLKNDKKKAKKGLCSILSPILPSMNRGSPQD